MTDSITPDELTEDLDNLRHMLGARSDNRKHDWGYRNHYCASTNSDGHASMKRLESLGYVRQGRSDLINTFYHATEAGCRAIGFTQKQIGRALYDE